MSGRSALKLPREFYEHPTLDLARALLGKRLVSSSAEGLTAGRIVETEAYRDDEAACHAYAGVTPRTTVMFGPPGFVYVYFIYGVYNCFNVVCEPEGRAAAVLVRALEPVDGIPLMRTRREVPRDTDLASGPGKLCIAMGIELDDRGEDLVGSRLWIEDDEAPDDIEVTARVGIKVARDLPWRFLVAGNPHVSRGKPSA